VFDSGLPPFLKAEEGNIVNKYVKIQVASSECRKLYFSEQSLNGSFLYVGNVSNATALTYGEYF